MNSTGKQSCVKGDASDETNSEGIDDIKYEAGKAVFSEKPIAEDPLGTSRCYEKAKEMGRPLFCAFNRRFDPSFSSWEYDC